MSNSASSLRQAMLALVAPAVASGVIQPGDATPLAEQWARYVATGTVRRHRTLSTTWGPERPRTKGTTMAGTVHRANELPYDLIAHDAITGAEVGLEDITFTGTVSPPEAGELTQPDAEGKGVFRPAAGGTGVSTCAVSFVADFGDGSEPVTLADSVTVDPDGRVVGIEWGPEQPRTGA